MDIQRYFAIHCAAFPKNEKDISSGACKGFLLPYNFSNKISITGNRTMVTIIVVVMPIPAIIPKSCKTFTLENIRIIHNRPSTLELTNKPEPKRCKVSFIDTSIFKPCFRFSKKPAIRRIQFPIPNKTNSIRARMEIRFIAFMKKLYIPSDHAIQMSKVMIHIIGILHIRKDKINMNEKPIIDSKDMRQNPFRKAV